MKNNKGQVLVVFLIFIPVLVLLVTLIVDYGTTLSEKKDIESAVREAITFGFRNTEDLEIENKIITILEYNIEDIHDIYIEAKSNTIIIVFTKVISFMGQEEETNFKYIGTKDIDNLIKIIEE